MKIAYITLFLALVFSTFAQPQDTISHKKSSKAKAFFSLQDTDTIRERNAINIIEKNDISGKKWNLTWSGLIGFDIFWDTRKPVEARDGGIYLYPADVFLDKNGKDVNARAFFNFCAMNTRLTLDIKAPKALGAIISGRIEGWFMGISNNDMNGFALRHAFIKMDWKSTQLLLGQSWHPLFTERMFAYTVAGSAGAPFQPFSRVPQVRVTQKFAKNNFLLAYLNAQRDLLTIGPGGISSDYIRQSMMPEMGLQYIFDYRPMPPASYSQSTI